MGFSIIEKRRLAILLPVLIPHENPEDLANVIERIAQIMDEIHAYTDITNMVEIKLHVLVDFYKSETWLQHESEFDDILQILQAEYSRDVVDVRLGSGSYGTTLAAFLETAGCSHILVLDATEDIFENNVIEECADRLYEDPNELILFSRFCGGSNDDSSFVRSFGRRFITLVFNYLIGRGSNKYHTYPKVTDATLAFKMYPITSM
mgnify:CR=1 FL=1